MWSVPIPMFRPGRMSVPRWRTKIAPACACSPALTLMPRYFGFESLPFFVEPPAFFVAIVLSCYNLAQ